MKGHPCLCGDEATSAYAKGPGTAVEEEDSKTLSLLSGGDTEVRGLVCPGYGPGQVTGLRSPAGSPCMPHSGAALGKAWAASSLLLEGLPRGEQHLGKLDRVATCV